MPLFLMGIQRELPHRSPEPVSLRAVQRGKVAAVLTAARQSKQTPYRQFARQEMSSVCQCQVPGTRQTGAAAPGGIVAIARHQAEVLNCAAVEDIHGIDHQSDIRRIFAWGRLPMVPLFETIARGDLLPGVLGGQTPVSIHAPNHDISQLSRFSQQRRYRDVGAVFTIDQERHPWTRRFHRS